MINQVIEYPVFKAVTPFPIPQHQFIITVLRATYMFRVDSDNSCLLSDGSTTEDNNFDNS